MGNPSLLLASKSPRRRLLLEQIGIRFEVIAIDQIEQLQQDKLKNLIDVKALQAFRDRALNPENPVTRGTAQNPDIFFQSKEAANPFYNAIPNIVENYMLKISELTGRNYNLFTYYGALDAENIIIAMGSVTETIKETIDYLANNGKKNGLVTVHLYRPFSVKHLLRVVPKSVKKITVLDRTKESGATGDPLYLDVRDVFYNIENRPIILAGRYGLGSKDTTPTHILSVFKNMEYQESKCHFTIGIKDDVTFSSLPIEDTISFSSDEIYEAKFYGIGADGTVGANKNSIKIIGDSTALYCQAYFAYDSKKSGGFTASHLRFGKSPIRSTYLVNTPDFVACHVSTYIYLYDVLKGLKKGGSFLLNSIWDVEETKKRLPDYMNKYLAKNRINFSIINATKLGAELGLGHRTNTIMQAAFFKITQVIPFEKAVEEMKRAIVKSYGTKGEKIVNMNFAAIEAGSKEKNLIKIEIPKEWENIEITPKPSTFNGNDRPKFISDVVDTINALEGDSLPVSTFVGREDGTFPNGTAQYEKRSIAIYIPEWKEKTCIQCNQCAYVCPHAAIRPYLLTDKELKNAPRNTATLNAIGKAVKGMQYRIQVAPEDCTGCANCVDVCPAPKEKALVMEPLEQQKDEIKRYYYMHHKVGYKKIMPNINVKNTQFAQPLFEFSGACAGCGETPYIKTITQLFGERMIIANATGCSSIYGGSAPSTPYCKNNESGFGPAWANSLFEDNAEYGLGLSLGVNKLRDRIKFLMNSNIEKVNPTTKQAFIQWMESFEVKNNSRKISDNVIVALNNESAKIAKEILNLKHYLEKKSIWIVGGDGWAYDIGFGGLDHVIASGDDVNLLVLDTEVYSNTGGQSSKATPLGAIAKFAASGKRIRKKDLGMMAMSYGYVYVAQIAMGANQAQCFKALKEAEAYQGPSVIIAYSPCISHGLRGSMAQTQLEQKKAVEAGYWQLYRYNPTLEKEKKNPFMLDSKQPKWEKFQDFLKGEIRYAALLKSLPEEASELFAAAEKNAKWRYNSYKRQAILDYEHIFKIIMVDLSIKYLGLPLKNPLIVGACPLTSDLTTAKQLEEAGAAALVLRSLFEEQIQYERMHIEDMMEEYSERNAEMTSLFPKLEHSGPKEYLVLLENLKKNLSIPVIASLNCLYDVTWSDYAKQIEEHGADAIELNFFNVLTDLEKKSINIEEEQFAIIEKINSTIKIPLCVKISTYYTNILNVVKNMAKVGADGFVLFNRFFNPEIDIIKENHITKFELTNYKLYKISIRYIGLLYKKVNADLIGNGGVYKAEDLIQLLLCGANAVQIVSAIYKNKPDVIKTILKELIDWMEKEEYTKIDDFKGKLSEVNLLNKQVYKRAQYLDYILNSDIINEKYILR